MYQMISVQFGSGPQLYFENLRRYPGADSKIAMRFAGVYSSYRHFSNSSQHRYGPGLRLCIVRRQIIYMLHGRDITGCEAVAMPTCPGIRRRMLAYLTTRFTRQNTEATIYKIFSFPHN